MSNARSCSYEGRRLHFKWGNAMATQEEHEVAVNSGKALEKAPARVMSPFEDVAPDPKVSVEAGEDLTLESDLVHEDIQQGADQPIPKQEQLKRAVRQHPQRDLPRVESIDAPEAPPRI